LVFRAIANSLAPPSLGTAWLDLHVEAMRQKLNELILAPVSQFVF